MPINILVLISARTVSGPVKGVLQILDNVDSSKFQLILCTFCYNNEPETVLMKFLKDNNYELITINQNKKNYLKSIILLCKTIKIKKINIVQTHGFLPTAIGFFLKILTKIKFICFMHGATSENIKVMFYNYIDNLLQLYADKTVLVSNIQRELVFGGKNKNRVTVLHNAVNLNFPTPISGKGNSWRKMFGISESASIVVSVGRLSPEKGMDVLIKAFSILCEERQDVHLVIVGDGQERTDLEKLISEYALEKKIHLAGYTQTPGDYVIGSDVMVLPSRSEGIPNAVLEAMALGIPVVATSVGGVPEVIADGRDGLLVPPDDPAKLAAAIVAVLNNAELAARVVAAGRIRMQEAFSVESRIEKIHMLYSELIPCVHQ